MKTDQDALKYTANPLPRGGTLNFRKYLRYLPKKTKPFLTDGRPVQKSPVMPAFFFKALS
jgi:hypothetical protein